MQKIHCDDIRNHIYIENGRVITPPEDTIDIFSVTSKVVPDWQPTIKLPPYESLSKIYLDIETASIPDEFKRVDTHLWAEQYGKILAIGLKNESGKIKILDGASEKQILEECFSILSKKRPQLIFTFNGLNFDLPYIYSRAKFWGIRSPLWINHERNPKRFGAAVIAGRYWDEEFYPAYWKFNGFKSSHIDLYQAAIGYDSILRQFNSFSLKELPEQLNLREKRETVLTHEEIQDTYINDRERFRQYLVEDLDDTESLANFFMPTIFYQKTYFPTFSVQRLSYEGNATKWSSVLAEHYGKLYEMSLESKPKAHYQGAITRAIPGVHFDVAGCDFSGQYPSCMMQYGIHGENDPEMIMLAVMNHAKSYRNTIKYKPDATPQEKDLATAVKPVINSPYGTLGSSCPWGDNIAAATVTLFARARILWAIGYVESLGGQVVLSDTDSIYVKTDLEDFYIKHPVPDDVLKKLPPNPSKKLLSAVAMVCMLRERIPSGSSLDLEAVNKIIFIPSKESSGDYNKSYKFKSAAGKKFVKKHLGEIKPVYQYALDNFGNEKVSFDRLMLLAKKFEINFPNNTAVRKNYLKLEWNAKKQSYKLKGKGKFVKRNVMPLEKEFQVEYLLHLSESPDDAENYYDTLFSSIASGFHPLDDLKVTRIISKSERKLVELGIGHIHDKVSYYMIDANSSYQPAIEGNYSISYYLGKLDEMYNEIKMLLNEYEPEQLTEEFNQLSLLA